MQKKKSEFFEFVFTHFPKERGKKKENDGKKKKKKWESQRNQKKKVNKRKNEPKKNSKINPLDQTPQ